jgi:hypothetical protein
VIPLPVILVEFLVAFGAALFLANAAAFVRLRRDGNWPPSRPMGAPATGRAARRAAAAGVGVPSRVRILVGMAVGLMVTLWAVATFVVKHYHL